MPKLAEAYVDITARDMKFKAAMKAAEAQTRHTAGAIERQFVRLGARLGSTMLNAGKTMALGLAAAGIAGGAAGLKLAADWEQAELAFSTMLGSASKASSFMKELEAFAARTPFELPGLIDASRKLLAFGFAVQDVLPMMTAIGDAVSGLGGGAAEIERVTRALGQMKAKGKVSAEEMNQLAEIGINGFALIAEKMGKSQAEVYKLAEKGAIDATTGINAVLIGMSKRFDGMMEKQSKTMAGRWSTLRDSMASILRKIGLDMNKTFHISGGMARLSKWFDENQETIRQWAKAAMEWIRKFAGYVIDAIPKAVEIILRIPQAWHKVGTVVKAVGAVIGGSITDMILRVQQLWAIFKQDFAAVRRIGTEITQNKSAVLAAIKEARDAQKEPWAAVTMPKMPTVPGLPTLDGKKDKPKKFEGLTGSISNDVMAVQSAMEAAEKAREAAYAKEITARKSAWEQVASMSEEFTVRMVTLAQGEAAGKVKAIEFEATKRREAILANVKDEQRRAMLLKTLDADVYAQRQAVMDEESKRKADEAKAEVERKRAKIGFASSAGEVWRSAMTAGARLSVPDAPEVKAAEYSKGQLDELKKIAEWSEKQYLLSVNNTNKLATAESML